MDTLYIDVWLQKNIGVYNIGLQLRTMKYMSALFGNTAHLKEFNSQIQIFLLAFKQEAISLVIQ